MKHVLLLLTLSLLCVAVLAQKTEESTLVKTGDAVPVFNFEIEKSKKVNITDYKGKLLLINMFATWCPPCRAELPEVQKQIWDKHKNNNKFALLVFGREEGWDVIHPFKEETGFTFPILPDTGRSIFKKFATQSIPRNFLIDEKGIIIYQSIGYDKNEFQKLVSIINDKLKN